MEREILRPNVRAVRIGAAALCLLAGTALLLTFTQPSDVPRFIGTVHRVDVPGMRPVWMELDLQRPPQVIALHGMHPELDLQLEESTAAPAWLFEWRHSTNPPIARITWDGKIARFFQDKATGTVPIDTNAPGIPLNNVPVAELVSTEETRGIRLFGHGTAGRWKSVRPRWNQRSALDQQVEGETLRIEQQYKTAFFKDVRDSFSLPELLPSTATGDWSFDLWQVTYFRSDRAVSVLNHIDSYTGGAHGSHGTIPINAMLGPGGIEWLKLSSIFRNRNDWKPDLRNMVMDALRRQGASAALPDDPPGTNEPAMKLSDDDLEALKFNATAAGIQIHFDPYEAGSYVEGSFTVELAWTRLHAWVRQEVLDAFTSAPALPTSN